MAKKKLDSSSAKKSESKKSAPGASPVLNLAATTAAAMVANKTTPPAASAPPASAAPKKESAAFKQLKAGLNKPAASALGGAFIPPPAKQKSNLPFGGNKQVGHIQTRGNDATRSGVPRRTAG